MSRLWVLTPTGGRPVAWALAERWMRRQTVQPHAWVIVDDCLPEQEVNAPGAVVIRRRPQWRPGTCTQARNLLEGIGYLERHAATEDVVAVWEDDDWYAPDYLETVLRWVETADLVGEGCARYYHIGAQRYHVHRNTGHASLCSTAFRVGPVLPLLRAICQRQPPMVDLQLWATAVSRRVVTPAALVVGVKGLPGRAGIGAGHRMRTGHQHDPDGAVLREWVGEDAELLLAEVRGEAV